MQKIIYTDRSAALWTSEQEAIIQMCKASLHLYSARSAFQALSESSHTKHEEYDHGYCILQRSKEHYTLVTGSRFSNCITELPKGLENNDYNSVSEVL